MDYLYDGSFEGLFTCIYNNYYKEKADGIYVESEYQYKLMSNCYIVDTKAELSDKVYQAIYDKISSEAMQNIYYVFLSNHQRKENIILHYLILGFKLGSKVDDFHSHKFVLPVHQLSRNVSFEAHRFLGYVRFVDVGNRLYCSIEPDHNILPLIADHFADRLANEQFIIHDKKRSLAIISNNGQWYLSNFKINEDIPLSENERHFQKLWKGYFDQIAIESRRNLRLQQQFVPKKYRKHLSEFIHKDNLKF